MAARGERTDVRIYLGSELHLIDGRWVMYFAAGPSGGGEDVFRIRTYAVVCDGPDPMTGNWSVLGQFQAPWDSFNLDSTVFTHRGTRYFAWAQRSRESRSIPTSASRPGHAGPGNIN